MLARRLIRLAPSVAVIALLGILTWSCSRPPWPPDADAAAGVMSRLRLRHDEVQSATYRVRWEARGTEPHGTFILQIAYQKPGKFRVTGTGPFDVPAFTAVVIDEQFWFIDHYNREFVHDQVDQLPRYDVPLASFFSSVWRNLFSGGCGGEDTIRLVASTEARDTYVASSGGFGYEVGWSAGKNAPKNVIVKEAGDDHASTAALTRFGRYSREFPFWKMESLELEGFPGGGRHRWKILDQHYNVDIPSRFFQPLTAPEFNGSQ